MPTNLSTGIALDAMVSPPSMNRFLSLVDGERGIRDDERREGGGRRRQRSKESRMTDEEEGGSKRLRKSGVESGRWAGGAER